MDQTRRFSTCMLAAGLMMSVSSAASATDAEAVARELNQNWNQAFNQGDAAAVADLYAEDAVISPGDGTIVRGPAAAEELFGGFIDAGVEEHAIEVVEAYRRGNVLYQVAEWQAEGEGPDGGAVTFGGVLMTAFKRGPGGEWQCTSHVWNMAD